MTLDSILQNAQTRLRAGLYKDEADAIATARELLRSAQAKNVVDASRRVLAELPPINDREHAVECLAHDDRLVAVAAALYLLKEAGLLR